MSKLATSSGARPRRSLGATPAAGHRAPPARRRWRVRRVARRAREPDPAARLQVALDQEVDDHVAARVATSRPQAARAVGEVGGGERDAHDAVGAPRARVVARLRVEAHEQLCCDALCRSWSSGTSRRRLSVRSSSAWAWPPAQTNETGGRSPGRCRRSCARRRRRGAGRRCTPWACRRRPRRSWRGRRAAPWPLVVAVRDVDDLRLDRLVVRPRVVGRQQAVAAPDNGKARARWGALLEVGARRRRRSVLVTRPSNASSNASSSKIALFPSSASDSAAARSASILTRGHGLSHAGCRAATPKFDRQKNAANKFELNIEHLTLNLFI